MRWRRVVVNHSGMSEAILKFNLHVTNPQEQTRHGSQEPDVFLNVWSTYCNFNFKSNCRLLYLSTAYRSQHYENRIISTIAGV